MSEQAIKAIETVYNGYRFRSRLEARWAVFFDWFKLRYEYEKEGYDLDGVWYLPDFWLPDANAFVEIKGAEPSEADQDKAVRLALLSECCVAIFHGEPNLNRTTFYYQFIPWKSHFENMNNLASHGDKSAYEWHEWVMRHDRLAHNRRGWVRGCLPDWKELGMGMEWFADGSCVWLDIRLDAVPPHPDVVAAYAAARQARFEHGESGAPR